jgi:pimeloyl-ACP methyl ester carboxylesterase
VTFVLVPGAWAGGWAWKDAAARLRAAGHDVHPVTLTGLGDRAHLARPDIGLETHVQDVVNVLHYEDLRDVILVGWSYAAIVVTAAAHQTAERVRRVVIIDTDLVPDDGQSAHDIRPDYREDDERALREGNGWQLPPPPERALERSMPDPVRRRWYVDRMTPMPGRVYADPARLGNPAADALPFTLIRCSQSPWDSEPSARLIKRIRSDPRWEIVELVGGHMAPFSQPDETADILTRVAR